MPKKSAKKKVQKHVKKHFLWSIVFLVITAVLNMGFIGTSLGLGYSPLWPMLATLTSAAALVLIGYERNHHTFGRGNWMWSIFFATLTLAITIYIAVFVPTFWPVFSMVASAIALGILVYEKHTY